MMRMIGAALALALGAAPAAAQSIEFASELPRTLVFIAEDGEGDVATRDFTETLRQIGFPLVDPALAHTAAQRDLVRDALAGDEGAAVQLGRDFGAQVLILGTADWGAHPDPVDRSLVTATAEVDVRALRLDHSSVVATARAQGRTLEATEQAARTGAIRQAATEVLTSSAFLGRILNDWSDRPWTELGYFPPDPGSPAELKQKAERIGLAPRLAVLNSGVAPPDQGGLATRGIGVIKKGEAREGLSNRVLLEGVVVGPVTNVEVEGVKAELRPLERELARSLGLESEEAQRFAATTVLPVSRDTIRVRALSPDGGSAELISAPRIDERWAVVVGIGDYASDEIPDLEYAGEDAEAVYDFLRSDAAGPFEEDHILFLRDGAATAQALREALFVFLQQADWDDLVVIYFAGHGAPDPQRPDNLYLLPTDAEMDQLAATAFPMWDVKTALRRQISAERVIVIADACHSGGAQEGLENPIGGSFADLFTPSRRLTLTAANANELSFEDSRWGGGHGVFTYHLLEGLRGDADADRDGIVTFVEMSDYVASKVSRDTKGRQNPQRSGFGDVPLGIVQAEGSGASQRTR